MIKTCTLTALLEQLAPVLAGGHLALADTDGANQEAVAFRHPHQPGLAAYVYSFGQRPGRLAIALDFPNLDTAPGTVVTEAEDLPPARVIEMLMTHFDVPVRG